MMEARLAEGRDDNALASATDAMSSLGARSPRDERRIAIITVSYKGPPRFFAEILLSIFQG